MWMEDTPHANLFQLFCRLLARSGRISVDGEWECGWGVGGYVWMGKWEDKGGWGVGMWMGSGRISVDGEWEDKGGWGVGG